MNSRSQPLASAENPAIPASRASVSFHQTAVLGSLADMKRGHLRLELSDGTVQEFGNHAAAVTTTLPLGIPAHAFIKIRRSSFFAKCLLYGDIGFAESYIDGDWETPDLTAVVAWFIHNLDTAPTLSGSGQARSFALNFLRFANRLGHLLRPNTRENARRNISAHYDLSNDFFELFLD